MRAPAKTCIRVGTGIDCLLVLTRSPQEAGAARGSPSWQNKHAPDILGRPRSLESVAVQLDDATDQRRWLAVVRAGG
jgi:hypothetical protein